MSCLSRRFALSALSLGFALALAASPAQARESSSSGWLGGLAHELAQWATGWWEWPGGGAAPAVSGRGYNTLPASHSSSRPPVRLRIECGGQIDPNGCQPAARPTPPARPPGRLRIECGGLIDPDGRCI